MSYMESAVIATSEVMSMNQSSEDHSSKACRWLVAVFVAGLVIDGLIVWWLV
jgi:hypothetical protein